MRYDISKACAERIAENIRSKRFPLGYEDLLDAIREEGVYKPPDRVGELLQHFNASEKDALRALVEPVALACAFEARELRETLHAVGAARANLDHEIKRRWPSTEEG